MSTYLKPDQTAPAPKSLNLLDRHGDYLFSYAKLRLRNDAAAERAVIETLLAALRSGEQRADETSERKWLAGILKDSIIDHYRKICLTRDNSNHQPAPCPQHYPFQGPDEWLGHWRPELAPRNWELDASATLEWREFWEAFSRCLAHLPEMTAMAFTLREIDGLSAEEVCEVLNLSPIDLPAVLHHARLELRSLMETEIFSGRPVNREKASAKDNGESDLITRFPNLKETVKFAALSNQLLVRNPPMQRLIGWQE